MHNKYLKQAAAKVLAIFCCSIIAINCLAFTLTVWERSGDTLVRGAVVALSIGLIGLSVHIFRQAWKNNL